MREGSEFPYEMPPALLPLRGKPDEPRRYALAISLGDIEAGRVERLAHLVETTLESAESAEQYVGRCMLVIDGYNADPRDLTQIPEVQRYFARAAMECPLVTYLCEPVREEMMLHLALLGAGRRVEREGDVAPRPDISAARFTSFPNRRPVHAFALAYAHALSEWLNDKGLVDQEDHPLWVAHARSVDALGEIIRNAEPLLSPAT